MNPSNVENSELRLVERAAAGDRDARRTLFERHRQAAYQTALRVTGRHQDALDVVQDAFVKAFGQLARFRHGSSFRTWLLRIVTNQALDLLRRHKVRLAVPLDAGDDDRGPLPIADDDPQPVGADLERAELAERLREALEALPVEQRTVFALYANGDMTYGEIAETLGIPIGTVMSRLYHARRRLQAALGDLAPGGTGQTEGQVSQKVGTKR